MKNRAWKYGWFGIRNSFSPALESNLAGAYFRCMDFIVPTNRTDGVHRIASKIDACMFFHRFVGQKFVRGQNRSTEDFDTFDQHCFSNHISFLTSKKEPWGKPETSPFSHRASPAFGGSHHLHSRHSTSWRRFPPWPGGQKLILRRYLRPWGSFNREGLVSCRFRWHWGSQTKNIHHRSLTARKNPWKMLGRKKQIRLPLVLDGNFSGASC